MIDKGAFMWKIFLLFLFLMVHLEARENPFESPVSSAEVGKMTDIEERSEDFESVSVELPSTARILKSVTVAFQNIDGSIAKEERQIDQNIDWHLPLILAPKASKTVAPLLEKKADTSLITSLKATPSKATPSLVTHTNTPKEEASLLLAKGITYRVHGREITFLTQDEKLRDFLIADPYKIVVDFKKSAAFSTKTVLLHQAPFVSMTLGDHKDFYRVAILLDGHYRYDITKTESGYRITLK